jgi:hypothetical protein
MRRRVRKSKNINEVDVLKGLWVRPMRKDVAKQPSAGLGFNIHDHQDDKSILYVLTHHPRRN